MVSDLEHIDMAATNLAVKMQVTGTSLAVQWLRLCTCGAWGTALVAFLVRELRSHM